MARIERVQPLLNCFCDVYREEATQHARKAENAVHSGRPLGLLHGIPIAIKDMTPIKGRVTTKGSRLYQNWVAEADAIVVERLKAAGAIIMGKTTTPEFAHSAFTESPLWGVTRNPWNAERTPGGSSGGSAVAVATGCVFLAEGSDMGGSIRTPASFCGIVGLKPSFGRIPFEIFPSVFDQTCHFGPLSRTVDDAAIFVTVTQGADDRDIQSNCAANPIAVPVKTDVQKLRAAFSLNLGYARIDARVAHNTKVSADTLRSLGVEVEEVDVGFLKDVEEAGMLHWDVYYAAMLREEVEKYGDQMDQRLVRMVRRGERVSAVELKNVEFVRTDVWRKLCKIFERFDVLLCPTTAVAAPMIGCSEDDFGFVDEAGLLNAMELTFPFNLVGQCPALSVPSGFTDDGLPTAIQIVGRRFDDETVLRVGAALEHAQAWTGLHPSI